MIISGPNLTALKAFSTKLQSTSNNIANSLTDGYKGTRVEMAELKGGGVSATVTRDLTPGPTLPPRQGSPNEEPREGSNVDLAGEMVNLITTQRAYQANARTIASQEETKGSILDIIK